jgi:glycosyltransferase involved in cell wall biosynthesis
MVPPDRLPDSVSAVLPAFNEARVIATTVRRTHAALLASGVRSFEIVVVDDGSTDGTRAEMELVQQELHDVRAISHPRNRGYGAALRTGFDTASNDAIFLMDSDGQFDPAELELLLEHWDGRTVVCGYRAHRSDPFARRVSNRAFFAIVNARLGSTARDVNCAFKLFPRQLGCGLASDGALISTELLVRARDEGYRIVNVAVSHSPRRTGTATGSNPRVVARAFKELWELDRRRRLEQAQAALDTASR